MGFLKSHKRSKWYKCFRPERHEDFPFEPVPCLANGGKESNINILRNNFLMALSDNNNDDNKLSASSNSTFSDAGADPNKKLSKSRRSLSRAFKAVLFPIPSAKKNRGRKTEQEKSFRSLSSGSSRTSSSSKLGKMLRSLRGKKSSSSSTTSIYKDPSDFGPQIDSSSNESSIFSSNSVTPASSLTTSRASSIASNSRSPSERKKSIEFVDEFKQLENKSNATVCCSRVNRFGKLIIGLFFLLVCLVALVLCGKALAVFCTSTCLFLVPCRFNKGVDHHHQFSSLQNDGVDSVDIDSDEHKKKVILEGLLERSRTTRVLI